MKLNSISILFWLYKSKRNSSGLCPIYCRLIINKIKTQISTGRFIKPMEWNSKKGIVKGRTEEAIEVNEYLQAMKQNIRNKETEFLKLGKEITAIGIKNSLFGKAIRRTGLLEIANYHQEVIKEKIDKGYSKGSIMNYRTTIKYLSDFIRSHYK